MKFQPITTGYKVPSSLMQKRKGELAEIIIKQQNVLMSVLEWIEDNQTDDAIDLIKNHLANNYQTPHGN